MNVKNTSYFTHSGEHDHTYSAMKRGLWVFLGAILPPKVTRSLVTNVYSPRRTWMDSFGRRSHANIQRQVWWCLERTGNELEAAATSQYGPVEGGEAVLTPFG